MGKSGGGSGPLAQSAADGEVESVPHLRRSILRRLVHDAGVRGDVRPDHGEGLFIRGNGVRPLGRDPAGNAGERTAGAGPVSRDHRRRRCRAGQHALYPADDEGLLVLPAGDRPAGDRRDADGVQPHHRRAWPIASTWPASSGPGASWRLSPSPRLRTAANSSRNSST